MRAGTAANARKRSVFLVDDHPIVRDGLAQLIDREPDLRVCGGAAEMGAALSKIEDLKPDVLILDISLSGRDGLDLLKCLHAKAPALPVLMMSMHPEDTYAERCLRAGASGYIMKHEATETVLIALRRVLSRQVYLSDRMANRMLRHVVNAPVGGKPRSGLEELTDRELEVLRLVGDGNTTRQIARQLRLSVKTVETYVVHVREKLHLRNGREVMQYAMQWAVPQLTQLRAAAASGFPRD